MTLNSDTKLKNLISGFKYDMSNLVNFYTTTQISENFTSTGSFCPEYTRFELKNKEELHCGFKNGLRN